MPDSVLLDLFPEGIDLAVSSWEAEGKSILAWQVGFLQKRGIRNIRVTDTPEARLLSKKLKLDEALVWIAPTENPVAELTVAVNTVYDKVGFSRSLRGKALLQNAVLWRIRTQEDLVPASTEWVRNEWLPYYTDYIKHAAHVLAAWCFKTPLTPNQLTLGTLLCAIAVLLLLVFDLPGWNWIAPPLIIFAVILDFADGRLARLKEMGSNYGAYLDSTIGDLTEDLCYLGVVIHVSRYSHELAPWAWILGTFYFFGKYQAYLSLAYQSKYMHRPVVGASGPSVAEPLSSSNGLAYLFVVFEFTTIRYHLLALSLFFGQPAWPLLFYAFHFNARWVMRVALVTLRSWRDKAAR